MDQKLQTFEVGLITPHYIIMIHDLNVVAL